MDAHTPSHQRTPISKTVTLNGCSEDDVGQHFQRLPVEEELNSQNDSVFACKTEVRYGGRG